MHNIKRHNLTAAIAIISFLLISSSYISNEYPSLLAGTSQKTWYLFSITPTPTDPGCNPGSTHSADNGYTFFLNGRFEFDHGTILRDPGCEADNCCSDYVSFIGKWELLNKNKTLKVTAEAEKNNPDNVMSYVVFNGSLSTLTNDRLVFSEVDDETKMKITFEFRRR